MWPSRYWPDRQWAPRYWTKVGATPTPGTGGGDQDRVTLGVVHGVATSDGGEGAKMTLGGTPS